MLYQSKYADLQVFIRSQSVVYHPATGVEISRVAPLRANFGHHAGEYMMEDPFTGQPERHAVIYGHFFDTDVAAEQNGWTEEEHGSVVTTLDRLCKQLPFVIAKVDQEAPVLEPDKPWPSYDETHHKTIPVLARQLGLVERVIAYERAHGNREGILKALEQAEEEAPAEEMITL
jgi:hypothetical protein